MSANPEGAVAEMLRHNPELISFQAELRFRVFEIEITADSDSLDVRTAGQSAKVPFPFDRLTSSERDPAERYKECRDLADDANDSGGIAYPCAAHVSQSIWNMALFGEMDERWTSSGYVEVERPIVDPGDIRFVA